MTLVLPLKVTQNLKKMETNERKLESRIKFPGGFPASVFSIVFTFSQKGEIIFSHFHIKPKPKKHLISKAINQCASPGRGDILELKYILSLATIKSLAN